MTDNTGKYPDELRAFSKSRFLWSLYVTELVLVLISLVVTRVFRGSYLPFDFEFGLNSTLLGLAAAVPIGLAVVLMMAGPIARLSLIKRAMSQILQKLRRSFGLSIRSLSAIDIVLLSLAAGIGEELFFRGMLQSFVGVWWAAAIFGLLHALTPAYFVLATAIGVWFGLLYELSDNLLIPMLGHATYDIFALYLLQQQFSRQNAR
ncbi:MAG: lysostaphin resistance A-like protein [Acidiferrobacterales bacterium]